MNKLILDAKISAQLSQAQGEVELSDEAGHPLGYFLPGDIYMKLMYAWARAEFSNEEERERARREPGGITTSEAIAYLEEVARSGRKNK